MLFKKYQIKFYVKYYLNSILKILLMKSKWVFR